MRSFVYHDGALGDVLLSLPCLKRIRAASDLLHLTGRADIVRFLKEAEAVDSASSSDQALYASLYSSIDTRLRTFLSGFDRAYVFAANLHSAVADAIRAVVPETRLISTIPPEGSGLHAARYRLSQLEPRALLSGQDRMLTLPSAAAEKAKSLLLAAGWTHGTRIVALHPGSGGRAKCWPFERYVGVIDRLRSDQEAFIILFTGEAEDRELAKAVRAYAAVRKNLFHAAGFDLLSAASLLSLADLYIGNDSGFSHLAGILECTTIVLFGPTDPALWRPLGPRVSVLPTGSLAAIEEIEVDRVIQKLKSLSWRK